MPSCSLSQAGVVYSDVQTVTGQTGASVGEQVLDHYEEGTWTPKMNGPGVSSPPTGQTSHYTRIGRLVSLNFRFNTGANMAGATSSWKVIQLPFSAVTSYYTGSFNSHSLSFDSNEVIHTYASTTEIYFLANQNNAAWQEVGFGNGSNWYMQGSILYHVS